LARTVRREARRAARGAALALLAWTVAGCLESTPPAVKSHLGSDGEVILPEPILDAGERDPDASFRDASEIGPDAWAGTWAFVSGSQGIACGNVISVVATSGFLDITPSSSGTQLTVREDGCVFHFTLADVTATSDPNQACAAWAIPTIPVWTLTMQPDGTLREKLGGRILMNGEVCTISGGSTLVRQ
jgi:hypothetical protein